MNILTMFIFSLLPKFRLRLVLFSFVDCPRLQLKMTCVTIWKTRGVQVAGQ